MRTEHQTKVIRVYSPGCNIQIENSRRELSKWDPYLTW
jgi:hypothetical protein